MRILGIDPGYDRLGWAVVERAGSKLTAVDYGLIQTPRIEFAERLVLIRTEVQALIARLQPDAMAMERLLFTKSKTTVFDVAKAAGVVLVTACEHGISCAEYSPPEVKLGVVGVGNADKKQVEFMVVKLLGLEKPPRPDDVSDALAVAICHAFRSRVMTELRSTNG